MTRNFFINALIESAKRYKDDEVYLSGLKKDIEYYVTEYAEQARKEEREKIWHKAFNQGFVCAVCVQIRNHGFGTEVIDLWKCNSLTKKELVENEISEEDINILAEYWDQLNKHLEEK